MISRNTVGIHYTFYDPVKHTYVLLAGRNDGNSKTTANRRVPTLDTTILGGDQVVFNDIKFDAQNCMDCPRSYNSRNPDVAICYAQMGHEGLAIRRLIKFTHDHRHQIGEFDERQFLKWWDMATTFHKYGLLRHGRYGDPAGMDQDLVFRLTEMARAQNPDIQQVGYTEQGHRPEHARLLEIMQASSYNRESALRAMEHGRTFFAGRGEDLEWFASLPNTRQCPASKEARKLQSRAVSCHDCGACSGINGDNKFNFYIKEH